jgi:hypothetical protein
MEKVEKRETFKIVEMGERKFRIEKFDALTGSYIAYQLLNLALPPMLGGLLAKFEIPLAVAGESQGRMMSKQEFFEFQKDCLKACFEVLPGAKPGADAPVMRDDRTYGVIGLEQDTATVLMLTAHVLLFNVQSFFEDGPWTGLITDLQTLMPSDAPT